MQFWKPFDSLNTLSKEVWESFAILHKFMKTPIKVIEGGANRINQEEDEFKI